MLFGTIVLAFLCAVDLTAAGGYPNYHAHFDFIPLDKEKTLGDLAKSKQWWEPTAFYQIYPRSFKDSDGDGVGDLNGITKQLHYLKDIGIAATWLSPIFTSPMADFGYDIANYTEIDKIFGTMADFEQLMAKSKEVGVKILLDFVPNHTSDESEWFKRSAQRDPEYADFYVWHPGKVVDGVRQPPTNWVSVFRGSAWKFHEARQEYYLHEFLSKQPDLNYRNPKVRAAMSDVLRFWLRKGVAGFRVDAVPFLVEAANMPDEPRNKGNNDPDDYGYLQHLYTVNQPETFELIYEWRRVLDEFQREHGGDERILMVEAYADPKTVMKYYGNATANGAQIPFNFNLMSLNDGSPATQYADAINEWLTLMPVGRTANWVLGNHDQHRIADRVGVDRIDMMNILLLTLPGCSINYYGEEIGMTNVWISWNDTQDPAACNSNPDIYERYSRDPERTPFQWSKEPNAGFSTAQKTWLPLADNYKQVNVATESRTDLSHLLIYTQLQQLRTKPTLRYGNAEVKALNDAVLAIKRSLLHEYTYVSVMNIRSDKVLVDLRTIFEGLPTQLQYEIITPRSSAKVSDLVSVAKLPLLPYEAVVLRSPTKLTTTVGYYTYYATDNH